jgi:acid stress-induced BolA-like protein IbaG/YrbA
MTSKLNNLAPLNDIPFKHLYVLANGGQADREFLETFAADVLEPLRKQINQLGDGPIRDSLDVIYDNLVSGFDEKVVKRVSEVTYSVEEWQRMIGSDNGKLNNITGDNILRRVWDNLNKEHIKESTPEEYFGFKAAPSQFCGIAICNGVFDIIGFKAEGKRRKFEKQDNVQSDAQHISMGAFCDHFVSADKKAVLRAQVIYEFLGLKTQARLVEL